MKFVKLSYRMWIPALATLAVTPLIGEDGSVCTRTAVQAKVACSAELRADSAIADANCLNLTDPEQREECRADAAEEEAEGREECSGQFEARRDICDLVGEAPYDPDFDPGDFVDPDDIGGSVAPNPLFPLVPGSYWVYEGGDEVVTDTVIDAVKLIEGVACRVVLDVVEEDGEVVEVTDDWYAQDIEGNVWYCGESSRDFETFDGDDPEEPELVSIEGSFKAGRDGARPGLLMPASPQVGDAYRQEMALGEAEDFAEVLSVTGSEEVPAASCEGTCLVTRDTTPLEPDVEEVKYYAPGIGLILETAPGEPRVELVDYWIP